MLDPNLLREKLKTSSKKLESRGFSLNTEKFQILSDRYKILQMKMENLRAKRNFQSKSIGKMIKFGKNVDSLRSEVNKIGEELDKVKSELEILKSKILDIVMTIPNLPDDSVPIGKNESCNIEIKRWNNPKVFSFNIRDHIALGAMHNWLDFAASVTLAGSRFVVMKGQVARLHRALIQFMLDLHTEKHGYIETYIPYLVNYDTLYGTGQLPRFSNDLFHVKKAEGKESGRSYALIPTAEVPLTNLVRNKILDEEDLPIKLTAHSPCFRSEVGSYGRDAHGLIRTHQFEKVEMVQIVRPEDSMNALEEMTNHAEKVLELLELPYRRMFLCTGEMSFGACKAYDIEVWIPSQNMYREISSCSNMWDFQARRMKARYRRKKDRKTCLVHTLNGSGLAVGRTLVAILENYQQEDGRVGIPEALQFYMNGDQYIG